MFDLGHGSNFYEGRWFPVSFRDTIDQGTFVKVLKLIFLTDTGGYPSY